MAIKIKLPPLEIWQDEVFKALSERKGKGGTFVVKSKRQVGKSILAEIAMIFYSLKWVGTSVCVEPTQAQSRRVFKQIVNALQGSGAIKSANATLLTIEFANGSEILFKSAEQRDALRGFTVQNLLVIDEAAFIPSDIFEILYPTTDANNAPILIISTPLFESGEFYEQYMRGMNKELETYSFDWSVYDTSKYLSSEKLEKYRQTLTPLKFQSEYLGLFIAEGSYIFGHFMKCAQTAKPLSAPTYAGIDWASGGEGDYTVITLMQETEGVREVCDIIAFNNLSPTVQVDKIAEILNAIPTLKMAQVELNSIGTVFYDFLKKKFKKIKGFQTTNESKRRIIEQLIKAFERGDISIPNNPELIKELQNYAMEKTQKGYTYNGANGVHDDYVLSLAFAYDLFVKGENTNAGGSVVPQTNNKYSRI